ncbi:MAG: hypothetical protein ACT4PU_03150 [Planctomycetota bacterium]
MQQQLSEWPCDALNSWSTRRFARLSLAASSVALLLAGCGGGGGGGGGGAAAVAPPSAPAALTSAPLLLQEVLAPGVSSSDRNDEIVTFGVPFAVGVVDLDGTTGRPALAIDGSNIYQFRALRLWDDGSVAWALADMQADIPAGTMLADLSIVPGTGESSATDVAVEDLTGFNIDTGPLQAKVLKDSLFNLIDELSIEGSSVIQPGQSPGIIGSMDTGDLLAPSPATVVVLEENGPARAVVRADGALRNQTTGLDVIDFTCRLTFRAGRQDVDVDFTVRNANSARPAHATGIEGIELAVRITPGLGIFETTTAIVAAHAGAVLPGGIPGVLIEDPFLAGESASYYQAYSSAATFEVLGASTNYQPHIPKASANTLVHEGYELRLNGVVVKPLTNKALFPPNGWADLRGEGGGCTVMLKQSPYFWPGALEVFGDGRVVAGVFTPRSPAPYTFAWRQHESRSVRFAFFRNNINEPDPPAIARNFDVPVSGRAADYKHYDTAGVFPYRLVTVDEQNEVYAALGVLNGAGTIPAPGQPHTVDSVNESLTVTRYLRAASPGGDNNHDSIERRLGGEWLRLGLGGPFLNAMDLALYKAEWQIQRSDNFLHPALPEVEGATNNAVAHTKQHQGDLEHRYRDGLVLAYFLSGDERLRAALLDEVEILPTLPNSIQEREMYMTLRAMAFLAGFTGDPGGVLVDELVERVDFFSDRQVNVDTQTSGAGWEFLAPDTGGRRYYVNSNQNEDEKPKIANGDPADEFFQTRGFITGSLGPLGFYHAGVALQAAAALNPGDADVAAALAKAQGRLRDLAFFTFFELYPTNNAANGQGASPVDWHWIYSYAVRLRQFTETATSDFHPLLLGMAETYLDTGDPAWLVKGAQQLHAFAAHDNSESASSHKNNLHEMESRLDAQHFFAVYRDFLGL